MQLRRLRHQILLAMGIPACWTGQSRDSTPPDPPPPDRGHETATQSPSGSDPWEWQDNPAAGVAQRCIPETVCGRSDTKHGGPGCGPHGDSLESFAGNYQKLSVTKLSWAANPQELRLFDLDPGETASYQRTVTVQSGVDRYCCYSHCTPGRPAAKLPVAPAGMQMVTNCVASPMRVANPHRNNPDCDAAQGSNPYVYGSDSQCCYGAFQPIPPPEEPRHYRGRAARVDGDAVVAPVRTGATWNHELSPSVAGLALDTREALRDAWRVAAQMEHASIAAFSALSLRLMLLGAPAELLARTHQAALDEIRHTQLAFALASAYAGAPLEPARFADVARLPTATTLAELARETFVDGCIEETAAAVDAALAAQEAEDPVVAAALLSIAEDETRHAELAWAIVRWCVQVEPAIAGELRAVLAAQPRSCPGATSHDLSRHGIRSASQSARTKLDVIREVVEPCLSALSAV